jgi:septal ring factor EnvC (AmiA/AmiB activator)
VSRFGHGRSTRSAECRTGNVLSRGRVLMVALVVALVSMPVAAHAESTTDKITRTRSAIDATAARWFESQQQADALDEEIATLEQQVAHAQQHAGRTGDLARARALAIYKGSGSDFGPVFDSDNALDSVRRAELLDRANGESERAIDALETAMIDLADKREELEARRAAQTSVTDQLRREQAELEGQLEDLRARADQEAAAAAATQAREAAAKPKPAPASRAAPAPKQAPSSRPAVAVTPPPASSGGTNPHHDDPFLVCTRARESGGNYSVVSASGKYHGAYQFSPTTWNATASHAGRVDLVGVLPSHAGVYDQDDMAWTLYQWQGKGPWGGRC